MYETCQGSFQMVLTEAKLKLFKLKMKQLSFFLSDSYGKAHVIVSHLDSSKTERCAVKSSKMFLARYKGKNLIFQIKLL